MIWKVSRQSKKCPDNLKKKVSGWPGKLLDNLESVRIIWKMCPDGGESVRMIKKVSELSGKYLDNLKSVRLIKKMCPADLKSVRMIWKVSWRSKKCPENLENVSGWSKKCLDNLENVSGWYGKCLGDLKNVWIIWKVSWRFKRGCHKFWIYIQLKKSIKCLSANSFPYKCTLWSIFGPFLCLRSCKHTFYGHLSQIR